MKKRILFYLFVVCLLSGVFITTRHTDDHHLQFHPCVGIGPGGLCAENVLTVSKTAFESFNLSVDFTQVIGADGMTLNGVTAVNAANHQSSTTQIIAPSPSPSITPSTDVVVFRVQGGVLSQTHLISVEVTDATNGSQYEGQIILTISGTP